MKNLVTKENVKATGVLMVVAMLAFLLPEASHAQNVGKLLGDTQYFKPIVTFGLGVYAGWKWFQYFANFSPGSAFTDIIVPAVMTFLAFKWTDVLKWFGITGA